MSTFVQHAASGDHTRLNMSGKVGRRNNGEIEPLQRFADAKKILGEIYDDLNGYVNETECFYNALKEFDPTTMQEKAYEEIQDIRESIRMIIDTFQRDNMKVVFFGRTSNGKSTTINAMLHSKILPQGMGHTTCCFLQVQGTSDDDGFLLLDERPSQIPLNELGKIGHALSEDNSYLPAMGQDSLLRVMYPKRENRLLQNDVVILDSPGVDLSPQFDSWIDKHCLDADVFVLVCNAEATLTQAEKSFFYRVSKKLSKPNVFILNNRWDASAADDNVEQVRSQHLTRFKQFLVDELQVCSSLEVQNRVFFVSSREVLDSRLKARGLIEKAYEMDGYQKRAYEFNQFERQFEQCISRSAIRSKFEAHARRADELVHRVRNNVDEVYGDTLARKETFERELEESTKEFNNCRHNFSAFEKAYREQTEGLQAEVHLKVSADYYEEIQRLAAIIDKFNRPFVDTPQSIAEYKTELATFVDNFISQELEARCTGGLMSRIWELENEMFVYVKKILAEAYQHKLEEVWRYRAPFKFSICVNAPSLTQDFHEDLDFRFSFGLSAIIRKVIAYRSGQPVTSIQGSLLATALNSSTNSAQRKSIEKNNVQAVNAEEQAVMTNLVLSSAAYVANGGIGLAIAGGLLYRTVGWKVILGVGAVYGGLYMIERVRWNSSKKEQHLKDQFRSHLGSRMQHFAAAHTSACETQVTREMEQVYDGLRATVGGVHREMKADLDAARSRIDALDQQLKGLSAIKGKTAFVLRGLEQFSGNFLNPDSPA
ncbi:unnamed protein product, partial [Mesorhabditis belari]|uniref:Dynamin-type G domain-containing protein n=1 Tax=Mesorhabditis belari TaxID=2138241 RepID=A0AAF3EZN3_9BILA